MVESSPETKSVTHKKRITVDQVVWSVIVGLIFVVLAEKHIFPKAAFVTHTVLSLIFKQEKTATAIGSLGGTPVSIPWHFARFLEYDGDPHFMDQRWFPAPKRTFESKIRSFGFEARYPDMAPDIGAVSIERRKTENIFNSTWLSIGVDSESFYFGREALKRSVQAIPSKIPSYGMAYRYEQQPEKIYGLTVYTPTSFDPSRVPPESQTKIKPPPSAELDIGRDIYFSKDSEGIIEAYIECSRVSYASAPCSHRFYIPLPNMRADITVSYRKGLLKNWREIQGVVTKKIIDFSVLQN